MRFYLRKLEGVGVGRAEGARGAEGGEGGKKEPEEQEETLKAGRREGGERETSTMIMTTTTLTDM